MIGFALAAWLVPIPASWIDRIYSGRIYLQIQSVLTPASDRFPFALLDVSILALLALFAWRLQRTVRRTRGRAWGGAIVRGVVSVLVAASALYLWFLGAWGMNYRRSPIVERVDFAEARLTSAAARRWAARAVDELNAGYASAHTARVERWDGVAAMLDEPFLQVQRELGQKREARPGRPKISLVARCFEPAGVSGLTDPWWLEVIPDGRALPIERPAILAHEWAHLAGYADEAEAGFVGWLVAMRAGPEAGYSAWLAILGHLLGGVPAGERAGITSRLAAGPRADLNAIGRRAARAWPTLARISWRAYDRYLRAHSVTAGVGSYRGVARLLVGSRFVNEWQVALRPRDD